MDENENIKSTMESKSVERKSIGELKNRWMEGVILDVKHFKRSLWWMAARNREIWRVILREAVTLGCCVNDDDDYIHNTLIIIIIIIIIIIFAAGYTIFSHHHAFT